MGTGSLRRRSLLLSYRSDLEVCALRGNVDTRLRKLESEELDAVVLACAGLERLGLGDRIDEVVLLQDGLAPRYTSVSKPVQSHVRKGDETTWWVPY